MVNKSRKNYRSNKSDITSPKEEIKPEQTVTDVVVELKNEPVTEGIRKNNIPRPDLKQIFALIIAIAGIIATLSVSFVVIPHIYEQTDEAKAAREKKETEAKAAREKKEKADKLAAESNTLKLNERQEFIVSMKIKIADQPAQDLRIKMNKDWAPKTVENFLRLVYRKYYDGQIFHRIVENPDFKVIQGGDPTGNGSGGETASGEPLVDELWSVKPQFDSPSDQSSSAAKIINNPVFREPSLYADFNKSTGDVTYRKGLILMAKTSAADSASSQFSITLDKTVLPAEYTVFGTIESDSVPILDTILKEVDPVPSQEVQGLTRPSKEIKIERAEIIS